MKVVIVGGVAGGASAAARLRRNDESAEIIMFERGGYISFANCGLPYYIGDIIPERDSLLVQTPEEMKARFNLDVRINSEVMSIDRENKKVSVKNLISGDQYEETYDKLLLSPGSTPLKPPIPGIDAPNIFTIWNIPDTDAIKNYLKSGRAKKAAIIGGGFIGIEMAENLFELGLEVSIIELADQVMAPLDFEMAQILHQHMNMKGIELYLNDGVKSFSNNAGKTTVVLNSATTVEADIIILAIGVKPNGELAKNAGLNVNKRGGIIVDKEMKTSDVDIYAVGDAVEVMDLVNQVPAMVPLAGPANKQGRIAADNIAGKAVQYNGTQGTSVAKVFDMMVSTTGTNEKTLKGLSKEYGKDYLTTYIHANNHAEYYPDASKINMKLIFSPSDGKVMGAQAVGFDGVEKRIDVIATAIRFGGTVHDLTELELAYAPPFGSAKDPVNMLGYVAENMLDGTVDTIHWNQLSSFNDKEYTILDVRDADEVVTGLYPGAIHIPLGDLRDRLDELDRNKTIMIYCAVGLRGYIAARILKQSDFKIVKNISGGIVIDDFENYKINSMLLKNILGSEKLRDSGDDKKMKRINSLDVEKIEINCSGLQCPGPIMKVFETIKTMNHGDLLEVTATDLGFASDISEWCKRTGNTLVDIKSENKAIAVTIMKGLKEDAVAEDTNNKTDKAMVVFSGDLDKALAAFIIANGAAAMGRNVTIFFTFWGLNILRRPEKISVKKNVIEKLFGFMMPRGSGKLTLSNMNMLGMGTGMIKYIMNQKNVDSLATLIDNAMKNGVKFVACTMSMDLMGIKQEELIDGVELGGVASFLAASERSDSTLFI
ncbi:MAG: FAD-dependent pyridine nucleotide-disulfide oxidoreductase [Clostridiales bacterium 38_11]|nr:MAG: FAD-dependent pyridine nucleotide-disulfide oxidoreductase [Clostridiales bacterium 38_11]HBH12794.1 pyridine nucleotide-disulfide oxidoreductase [Clostridiales bacterium]